MSKDVSRVSGMCPGGCLELVLNLSGRCLHVVKKDLENKESLWKARSSQDRCSQVKSGPVKSGHIKSG